jgi:hypothetical protein
MMDNASALPTCPQRQQQKQGSRSKIGRKSPTRLHDEAKKMALVHAIKPLSKDVTSAIHRVNTIRNAFAHSFFPENRKEHRKNKKVLYNGKDIRTYEGIETFIDDAHTAFNYLARRAGRWTE